jgi:hypothetical protein
MCVEVNDRGVKMLVKDPEEQETIRLAKEMRMRIITRRLRSGKEIGEELARLGRRNRGGEAKWYPSQVMAIVKYEPEGEQEEESSSES